MFFLALVYAVILIVFGVFSYNERWRERAGIPQLILFGIIGFVLFWSVLNR